MDILTTEYLQQALLSGIIDSNTIISQIEMKKRENILTKHKFSIYKGTDGKWHTYLPADTKRGRREVRRKTRAALETAIVDFYKQDSAQSTSESIVEPIKLKTECDTHIKEDVRPRNRIGTFEIYFYEWLDQKMRYKEICLNTYNRYEEEFKYYIVDSDLNQLPIDRVDDEFLEDWIKKLIADNNLTAKRWEGIRTVIKGTFRYARKHKATNLIIDQFLSGLEISDKAFRKTLRSNDELIFNKREVAMVKDYILSNKPSVHGYAILFDFETGLRPGELAALKWEDITDVITIHATEVHKKVDGHTVYEVRPFPKTQAGFRTVVITPEARWILDRMKEMHPNSKWVWEYRDKRIIASAITKKSRNICKELGIKPKSLNKVRKTFATRLINGKVDESIIIDMMGHVDIKTTKDHYYYDDNSHEEKLSQVMAALHG